MFARLSAKAILLGTALALVFFGVGLIGLAIATVISPYTGVAGGYAIAGALMLLPPLIWAFALSAAQPARPANQQPPSGARDLMNSLFAAVARETPWAAVAGAGVVGVLNLFLNRNKPRK